MGWAYFFALVGVMGADVCFELVVCTVYVLRGRLTNMMSLPFDMCPVYARFENFTSPFP